ncbi:MAG TPA: methyltransferase domain-containing protein [Actinomycetota bacterium]|nr:methyltransferase domain-containing protein [Actinomycetota bacterium]
MTRRQRQQLVRRLETASAIRTQTVRTAFLEIPREIFIPDVAERLGIGAVYRDEAHPIKTDTRGDAISSSSQPQIMALMLEEARVSPGHRILEIGTGTGYNAALLSALVGAKGRVTSIELDPQLASQAKRSIRVAGQRARVIVGDGRRGWRDDAPYDRIIATASSLEVPRAFLEQLNEGGLLVLPVRLSDAIPFRQIVVTFQREGDRLRSVSVLRGGFMRLRDRPEDPSLPWPLSKVVETRDGTERTVAELSGPTLNRLAARERRDLLALLLSRPRSRAIGMRVSDRRLWELESFILLAAPEGGVVGCAREDLGQLLYCTTALPAIIDTDSSGLAHLSGVRTASRIDAYGGDRAERMLADLVDEWRRRGRPGVAQLGVEVSFGHASRVGVWRSKRRGSSTIAFDYR